MSSGKQTDTHTQEIFLFSFLAKCRSNLVPHSVMVLSRRSLSVSMHLERWHVASTQSIWVIFSQGHNNVLSCIGCLVCVRRPVSVWVLSDGPHPSAAEHGGTASHLLRSFYPGLTGQSQPPDRHLLKPSGSQTVCRDPFVRRGHIFYWS